MIQEDKVIIAKIVAPQGIKGDVKLLVYSDDIERHQTLYNSSTQEPYKIKVKSVKKNTAIVHINGVEDRNKAESVVGEDLFIPYSSLKKLKKNQYYHHDLVGLDVLMKDRTMFGKIIGIDNFGSGDIVNIKLTDTGKEEYFLFNLKIFPEINIKERYVVIEPPEFL